jgi:hypothetical protein
VLKVALLESRSVVASKPVTQAESVKVVECVGYRASNSGERNIILIADESDCKPIYLGHISDNQVMDIAYT